MQDAVERTLWEELAALLRAAAAIWGQPAQLWEERVLPRAEARRLGAWLASLEAMARALLAVMAARLPAPAPERPAERRRTGNTPPPTNDLGFDKEGEPSDFAASLVRGAHVVDPEIPDSEQWAGVAFRLGPPARRGPSVGAPRPEERRGALRFLPTRALAFRFEALIRVAAAPERYARRLARRLRTEPALEPRLVPPVHVVPGRPPPHADLVAAAQSLARAAFAAPDTG